MEKTKAVVTVVRSDGKEFVIQRALVAEHVNRGFRTKELSDMPSEGELKKAVGYREPKKKPEDGPEGLPDTHAAKSDLPDTHASVDQGEGAGDASGDTKGDAFAAGDLKAMTVPQLKALAQKLDLSTSGKKADLIKRINASKSD